MALTFVSALHASNSDEATVLTVITGEGDYFTSGMDMSSLSKPTGDNPSTPKPAPVTVKFQ